MCLIAKNSKAFKSAKFKTKLYTYDKTDPKNLKLPPFINDISDNILGNIIPKIADTYREKSYIGKTREELEDEKEWNDLTVLLLIKFYSKQWSFIIPNDREFFPSFSFTYNLAPLKKEIDKIISHIHDHLNPKSSKQYLSQTFTYSALEVTYLLHYFALMHPDYKED